MALAQYGGHIQDANLVLIDNLALSTGMDTTTTGTAVYVGNANGKLAVKVYAREAISITAATLGIIPYVGATSNPVTNLGIYILAKSITAYAAGALIAEWVIPPEWCAAYKYLRLNVTLGTSTVTSGSLDAFIAPLG